MKQGAPSKEVAGKLMSTAAGKGLAKKSNFKGVTWHNYNRRWRSSLPIASSSEAKWPSGCHLPSA
ncbi:hypothetical protein COCSUDRAFT_57238 [Coccomyxa subellipsoidea C-169]|uniref:Uncharacterized protein n=1 Tax=Coccomyxa subellipsoidea (strain C-169) TaxID=574566 RepID=I0YQK2_COCSC|nr:hypothetical protein COCSUDRAFT_57238 [Coccomyxa subellipsoidea C-169]EIE20671.1 hypothetical protein COCSUDRAFT_57238 [Coccomyxa subellipsoidea C-169]|eukprot:XP_005645215.1 hypothetical protein COCSUDRAFT_57238 [Coccomyxa subellipsoidea C-169]